MLSIGKIIETLTARGKPDDPTNIAAAIQRLEQEKSGAEAEMAVIAARRQRLLLEDRDAELDADERKAEKAYRVVEKVDAALPDLRARLAAAQDAERQQRWRDLQSKFDAGLDTFSDAYRKALEAFEGIARVRGEAQGSGFAAQAAGLPSVPHILDRSLLELLEAETGRRRAAAQPRPAPAPLAVAPPPAKPAPAAPKAKAPALKAAAPVTPRPAPEPFKPVADSQGNIRVVFLKAGYSLPDGLRPKVGDVVDLPEDVAKDVVRATVAEFEQSMEVAL